MTTKATLKKAIELHQKGWGITKASDHLMLNNTHKLRSLFKEHGIKCPWVKRVYKRPDRSLEIKSAQTLFKQGYTITQASKALGFASAQSLRNFFKHENTACPWPKPPPVVKPREKPTASPEKIDYELQSLWININAAILGCQNRNARL